VWYEVNEIAISHRKRLMTYEEFTAAAFGTTEGQSLGGAASTIPDHNSNSLAYTSEVGYRAGDRESAGRSARTVRPLRAAQGWVSGPGRGNIFWIPYTLTLGGSRDDSTNSGSRCAAFSTAITTDLWKLGLRCAADHFDGGAF